MGYPFGQYELIKRLAAGGMGEVFLARRRGVEGFEKLAVIKTLLPHLVESEEFLTMFLDEARLAARLDHPNIGQIFELGEQAGTYFIAMEYILGDDLQGLSKTCAAQNIPIPVPLICRIAADALAGLHYSHELTDIEGKPLDLVHRDVSPHNILATYEGGVKLIDFGIAKAAGRMTNTSTGQVKGKFAYMPPEQAWGENVDRRADIFALGIVMHELLTGKPLFKHETEVGTIKAISDCNVPAPSTINPKLPPSLDAIVLKALARDKENRYPNAEAFRYAIENWIVKNRQQASSAHLASFMQKVYADRLQQQRSKGPLWFVDLDADIEPPKGYRPPKQEQVQAQKSNSKIGIFAAAALALLGVIGAGFFMLHGAQKNSQHIENTKQNLISPRISIETKPAGVTVSLDGRPLGITPLRNIEVARASGAKLELSSPGLVPRSEILQIDKDMSLSYIMKKAMVSLQIESEPSAATVRLGDEVLGKTPLEYQAKPQQRLELRFSKPGFHDKTEVLSASDGQIVHSVLKKKRAANTASHKDDIPTF